MPVAEVSVRPLRRGDAPTLAAWADDPQFCREAEWSLDLDRDQHLDFWRRTIERPAADLLRLGVLSGHDLVGYVDLHGTEPDRRELGFVIGTRDRWGQGLGLAAARAGLDQAFRVLEVDEVWAEALDANTRSVWILQRLGMQETGRGEAGHFLSRPTFYRRFTTSVASPSSRPV